MRLIRGRHNLHRARRGGAVTVGNFDGVHLGHQAMLNRARQAVADGPLTVISFEPRPLDYFLGERAPSRVTGLRDRCRLLAAAGVDQFLLLRFDAALAGLSPQRFEEEILVGGLAPDYVLIGDDFRYGKARAGSADSLRVAGRRHGFRLDVMPTVEGEGTRVSSTRIRERLEGGDLEGAARLLGRPVQVSGRVRHGRRLGRELAYPTLNLAVHERLAIRDGVHVARVTLPDGHGVRPAIASLGRRPTVDGRRRLLEVHVFDWQGELYGQHVCVDLLHHLRDEERFEHLEALRAQMDRDSRQARAWLAEQTHTDDRAG
ncbi:bifunctional riboflavin kinase/FAD synthetase [Natronospira bacteriovora]|uniref:Riboflavin biosynthesis protein n=1 Tax=Natronospira bacteriovora TaxID=3069753 RepID=A0ABU0W5S5_9GAMM|nr:bifunctional riboflavin kinase/FAD synthetase [Natronospira sp. AB-CW4]MDQ2069380.1 bifunctional riboflavin kinase/FAD synthetase [Natronospira sp. AB-CW4]